MENTDDNDSEIFYDAYERISESQKNSSLGGNSNSIFSNLFSKERKETIYHDLIDIKEKENCENILGHSKEKQIYPICEEEKENVISENKKDFNPHPKLENKFEMVKSKNENRVKSIDKTNINTLRNKSELMHHGIKEKDIDIEYLRQNLKQIQTKSKNIKDKHFQNLFELQCFQGDSQQILVAKISYGGKYLATGGLSGVLKIWIIYTEEDSLENYENRGIFCYLKFLNENAFRSYDVHKKEIIEINWHPRLHNYFLSASLDKTVILWDVDLETHVSIFEHPAIVSAISFCPISDELIFVSGCFDRFVRIWNPQKSKITDYINIQEYPISIEYFPTGNLIAVGSHNGKISVYDSNPKLKYSYSFFCKNKSGKYSDGRKVTSIEFLNKNHVLITTNDSSIRLVNINDGKIIQKYKGLSNDEFMIRASFEEIYDLVISSSDDGNVFVWKKLNPNNPNVIKNKSYEFFKCFENKENPICSIFVNDISLSAYIKKILMITQKFFIKSIIINTSINGKIQVLINTEI